jgi:hypothetical protein
MLEMLLLVLVRPVLRKTASCCDLPSIFCLTYHRRHSVTTSPLQHKSLLPATWQHRDRLRLELTLKTCWRECLQEADVVTSM